MAGGFPLGSGICNGNDIGSVTGSSIGTSITPGAADTMGSFIQLVASTTYDTVYLSVNIYNNSTGTVAVNIAVGGAGSEKVIIQQLVADEATSEPIVIHYCFPVAIPAGTRISAQSQSASGSTCRVNLCLFDGDLLHMEGCAGVDSMGFVAGSTQGTTLTASGSTNTKGSYATLVASTTRDYLSISGYFDSLNTTGTNAQYLCDIAVGAAASEQNIIPNLFQQCSSVAGNGPFITGQFGPIPILIPAGTRVSARIQCSTASGKCGLTLYGVYQ